MEQFLPFSVSKEASVHQIQAIFLTRDHNIFQGRQSYEGSTLYRCCLGQLAVFWTFVTWMEDSVLEPPLPVQASQFLSEVESETYEARQAASKVASEVISLTCIATVKYA